MSLYQWMEKFCPEELEKIIFLTRGTQDRRTQIFFSQMSQPQLVKPFHLEELKNEIGKILLKTTE